MKQPSGIAQLGFIILGLLRVPVETWQLPTLNPALLPTPSDLHTLRSDWWEHVVQAQPWSLKTECDWHPSSCLVAHPRRFCEGTTHVTSGSRLKESLTDSTSPTNQSTSLKAGWVSLARISSPGGEELRGRPNEWQDQNKGSLFLEHSLPVS